MESKQTLNVSSIKLNQVKNVDEKNSDSSFDSEEEKDIVVDDDSSFLKTQNISSLQSSFGFMASR